MGTWAVSSKGWSALDSSRWVLSVCGHMVPWETVPRGKEETVVEAPETPVLRDGWRKRPLGRKWGKVPEGKRNTERVFSEHMKPDKVKVTTSVPSKE